MRVAMLADIHGNLEALAAVHADLQEQRVERVVCLGDNVGYGPDPDAVVDLVLANKYEGVMGNHEYALFDPRARRWLNFQAAENNEETALLLSPENLAYCRGLPFFLELGKGYCVHGFPPDSVFRYLNRQKDNRLTELFRDVVDRIYFLGHTHTLSQVVVTAGRVSRDALVEGITHLSPGCGYVFSCGSVGQPRDGNKLAKYLIWDSEQLTVQLRFVDYDRAATMAKIRRRGFPDIYALRLR